MEKIMTLVECSALNQRTVNTQNGSQVIESFEVVFSDNLDTIMGETSKNLTVQFKNEDTKPDIGGLYNVRFSLNVIDYEKEGKKGRFFKCTVLEAKHF